MTSGGLDIRAGGDGERCWGVREEGERRKEAGAGSGSTLGFASPRGTADGDAAILQ